ncbi:phosphoglycolate phosphatase [Methylopila henanensis]|uniref:Phosphoglycolate phosphatase n=1 Tax=Methylopila henanensis TaxID=873516 RepID=A0ABW4KC33_9HYPH
MPLASSPAPLTVVFDLDGTLVESAPDLVEALAAAMAAEGLPRLPAEEVRGMMGAGARALVERGLRAEGVDLPEERVLELYRVFLDHYDAHIADRSHLFPGAEAALDRLAASGAKLAICTNKLERFAVKLLDELGAADRFGAIVGGDTFGVAKPDPKPLTGAIERVGGDPARAVMIGDSATDVETAKAAGIPSVVMSFGYTTTPPRELGGDVVIDHFDELDDALRRLGLAA